MSESKEALFQALLGQIHWTDENTAIQNGWLENVVVHTKSRLWQFKIGLPTRIDAATFLTFEEHLKKGFDHVGAVDFSIEVADQSQPANQAVLDYWPIIVNRSGISNGIAKATFQGQLPSFENNRYYIRVDNQPLKQLIQENYLEVIKQNYQMVGFPKVPFEIIIDEETAKDRRDVFVERANELAEQQQEIAKKAAEKQKEMAATGNNGQAIKVDKIQLGKHIPVDDKLRAMNTYVEEQRFVSMEGVVFDVEVKILKTGRRILNAKISDYTSAFLIQMFSRTDEDIAIFDAIRKGMWLRVRGDLQMDDRFARDLVLNVRDLEEISKAKRQDNADKKRVELHVHTNMSMLDATNSISDFTNQAKDWGHTAIAVTDHATLQAYPEASGAAKSTGLKMIYGVEANIVDDGVPIAYNPDHIELKEATYVVFDVETTGLSAIYDNIIELAAVKMQNGNVIDTFEEFINPGRPLSATIIDLTGITDAMLANTRTEKEVITDFREWVGDAIFVAHNASFDMGFIDTAYNRHGFEKSHNAVIDTLEMSRFLHPNLKSHRLNTLAKRYNVALEQHHRAVYDAETTGALAWIFIKEAAADHEIFYHDELNKDVGKGDAYKQGRPFHAVLLAKNQTGLKDLFKLVSASNIDYYYRVPRIPRSLLSSHRENLLVGSACAGGEVFEALMQKGKVEAEQKAAFYDYLELQPKGVYKPLILDELIQDEATLEKIMKDMIEIGESVNKPVVATGDVHYLNEEDKLYREILINSIKSNRTKNFPEAHFRSTEEMLHDFAFLGEEKAFEIVVENSNAIADSIEFVEPLKDKLYTPTIEGAEQELTDMSFEKAHEIYGKELPEIVEARLNKELKSIISNGFSVIYLISQKLVKKSNDDGYIVGSRGSVGSSFVATMSGITEVNPLAPHYVCPNCHYSHFFTDGSVGSGFDLPDKPCPECGTNLDKDGQDIPFETFLGFKGDKVPDIDLNFSGEYQARAHAYTKVLFGDDHVFRAGTIGTVADKTAFGYVLGYDQDKNLNLRKTEKEFLAKGATGVKRTTGQHPGGIIVIPENMDVYDFTPIQFPADDVESEWKTTHFDFHSIHDNVLKLDILGHDDPTMIRKLQDLSGFNPTEIPTDDPEVYELFNGTEVLGVTKEQIYSNTGTLGIPEFGTRFTRQMLEATKPSTFAELLQISGLSHGTDVWLGNAEVLVREKGLPLSEVIGCRDDIMVYLIHRGLPESDAFQIMEKVRKGKGLSEEHKSIMREYDVPEWYMDSCEKIKYMFPKAHAAAYVLNAMRVAWFKVKHPIWYYCAYLSVRASDFDLVSMSNGKESTKAKINEINAKGMEASTKEKQLLTVLEIVNEMWERGFTLKMVDINKSHATEFIIEDGNTLIAPFRAIDGLGTNVAKSIVAAREESPFLSKEDLQIRGKVSKSLIEYMTENHVLDGLPDQNQLSLFDF